MFLLSNKNPLPKPRLSRLGNTVGMGLKLAGSLSGLPSLPYAYQMGRDIWPPLSYFLVFGTATAVGFFGFFGADDYTKLLRCSPIKALQSKDEKITCRFLTRESALVVSSWLSLGPIVSLSIMINGATPTGLAVSALPLITDLGLRMSSMTNAIYDYKLSCLYQRSFDARVRMKVFFHYGVLIFVLSATYRTVSLMSLLN